MPIFISLYTHGILYELNENVFIKDVDGVGVAYSAFSNEIVILHPITHVILMLLQKPMQFFELSAKMEKMDFESKKGNELEGFVSHTISELVLRGFINVGVFLNGTTEESI